MSDLIRPPVHDLDLPAQSPNFPLNPQPVDSGAFFRALLRYQCQSQGERERRQGVGLDQGAAKLLPLLPLLSLARLSAREKDQGVNQ